ncbi:MAG: hypothetical protein WAP03_22580 [Methylorubrum rhodinum]|uniref:hypothetical protein n=1 Tax=Methylorubrum rhodinum TaxID=29428 RepID=UPI003BB206F0
MSEHELYSVGDYIFERMPEADRETFRRFMLSANGGNEDDVGYSKLCHVGINVARSSGCAERVEDHHIRLQLAWMAKARLIDETMDEHDWYVLTHFASDEDKAVATRLRSLFVLATGISDEDAFDEKLRSERRARESARG